jgi:hypothetical protein
MAPSENAHKQHSLDQVCLGQNTRRQNGVDQFVLRQSFGLRCRLQVLVRDMEVAVPQVVADRKLMFALWVLKTARIPVLKLGSATFSIVDWRESHNERCPLQTKAQRAHFCR